MGRLEGKVALVTGGTSGIGRATSVAFAREGARIVVTGLATEAEGGAVTVDTILQQGGEAFFLPHDVREEDDWRRVVSMALERFGRLDVLDNNAGVAVMLPIEQLTLDHFYFQARINIEGCFLGLKHSVPAMKKGGGGSVINMSSAAGLFGSNNGTSSYSAAKGGIAGLTKAAALEFRPDNVRVNSVHPGFIRRIGPTLPGQESSSSFRDRMKTRVPLGKIGEPVDIANMILYLASDESREVTGAEFVVDGGYLAA